MAVKKYRISDQIIADAHDRWTRGIITCKCTYSSLLLDEVYLISYTFF